MKEIRKKAQAGINMFACREGVGKNRCQGIYFLPICLWRLAKIRMPGSHSSQIVKFNCGHEHRIILGG